MRFVALLPADHDSRYRFVVRGEGSFGRAMNGFRATVQSADGTQTVCKDARFVWSQDAGFVVEEFCDAREMPVRGSSIEIRTASDPSPKMLSICEVEVYGMPVPPETFRNTRYVDNVNSLRGRGDFFTNQETVFDDSAYARAIRPPADFTNAALPRFSARGAGGAAAMGAGGVAGGLFCCPILVGGRSRFSPISSSVLGRVSTSVNLLHIARMGRGTSTASHSSRSVWICSISWSW